MLCIECPLYEFDGKQFRCPATPWHEVSNGMFQKVDDGTCLHRNAYAFSIRNESRNIKPKLDSVRKHISIANEALKYCDSASDLAKRLRSYVSQCQDTLANGLLRLEYLNRQLCKLTVEVSHEPKK